MGAPKVRVLESAFDTYKRVRQVGSGGAGAVIEVRNAAGETYAAKYLNPDQLTADKVKRFRNELSFCSKTTHPHIIRVLDWGWVEIDGQKCPFYIMPLYAGSLRELMKRGIEHSQALALYSQVLDGVEAAHLLGVCHRDLKPENVLCDSEGESLVVADFGIARFAEPMLQTAVETQLSSRLANFQYAAPEQRERGAQVDTPADVYALGLLLNEMFTGRIPLGVGFLKIESAAAAYAYLDDLVDLMLMQEPTQRPASIAEIKRQLVARGETVVEQQKLSRLKDTVIPAGEADDLLIDSPPELLGVKWEEGVLVFTLSQAVNDVWAECFKSPGDHTSVMGFEPNRFRIRGTHLKIGRVDDQGTAQRIVDYTKDYVAKANRNYRARLEREAHDRQRREEEALRQQIALAEKSRTINDGLKL